MWRILQQDVPEDYVLATGVTTPVREFVRMAFREIGIEVEFRGKEEKETGVVVTRVETGSPAAEAGIQTGDVIHEVNRKPVKNVEDFIQKVEKAKDQENVLLFLQRGQSNLFAAVTPK
jgi:S1-C subfamily serine protease